MVMQNFRGQTRCIMGDSNHRGIFFDKIYPSLPGGAVDIDFFSFSEQLLGTSVEESSLKAKILL